MDPIREESFGEKLVCYVSAIMLAFLLGTGVPALGIGSGSAVGMTTGSQFLVWTFIYITMATLYLFLGAIVRLFLTEGMGVDGFWWLLGLIVSIGLGSSLLVADASILTAIFMSIGAWKMDELRHFARELIPS